MPGLSCPNPKGAFYAFPKIEDNKFGTDKEFVQKLLETKGVLTVHGLRVNLLQLYQFLQIFDQKLFDHKSHHR